jgi:hypothetical protein
LLGSIRHAFTAEQHDPEERRFQHEGGECFVTEQRSPDRTGLLRQHTPVGAELKRHDDAGHDSHAERHREHLQPEIEHPRVENVAGSQSRALDRREPRRQPDRECREDDVKGDNERELEARQENRIELHGQGALIVRSDHFSGHDRGRDDHCELAVIFTLPSVAEAWA